jgi:hypothetical protein
MCPHAVTLADYFADFSLSRSTTFERRDLEIAARRRSASGTIVYSVINGPYLRVALNWAAHLRDRGIEHVVIVATDTEAYEGLRAHGIATVLVTPRIGLARDRKSVETGFASDSSIFVISLKFHVARELLDLGSSALFSDVDAIWQTDPHPLLDAMTGDLLFQVGSYPDDVRAAWGFTACTGFLVFRNSPVTRQVLDDACRAFATEGEYDDQKTLNRVLLGGYTIRWEGAPPAQWQHCALANGWTEPIRASSGHTTLRLVALPHAYFQRHKVTLEDMGHAVICHPNSPKNEADKIELFRALGLWHASMGPSR